MRIPVTSNPAPAATPAPPRPAATPAPPRPTARIEDRASAEVGAPRPVALAVGWFLLMAVLAIAARYAQSGWGIGGDVVPLVMAAPAVAAAVCRLVVPGWFPPRTAPARWPGLLGSAGLVALSVGVFLVVLASATPGHGWQPAAAVVPGMVLGSLAEEVGFRGVLYRAMAYRRPPWAVIPANGLLFGLCHLQNLDSGPGPLLLFLGAAVLLDVAMVAAWTGSWTQRVVAAGLLHAGVNLALAYRGADGPGDSGALLLATAAAAAVTLAERAVWARARHHRRPGVRARRAGTATATTGGRRCRRCG